MKNISSTQNEEIKHIVKLQDAKFRNENNQVIIEGFNAISAALNNMELEEIYVTAPNIKETQTIVKDQPITVVTPEVMEKISTVKTPSGFLAVFKMPVTDLSELTAGLVLAQISDPGNMGTIIRTAAAVGVKSVVIIDGCDVWNPKVIAASAGTISMVKIFKTDWQTLVSSKKDLKLVAMVVKGGANPKRVKAEDSLIIVGNEAHGISADWLKDCDQRVTLPMPGGVESLNAAVAGSILLYVTNV